MFLFYENLTSSKLIRSEFKIVFIFFDLLDLDKILILEYNVEECFTICIMVLVLK